MNGADDQFTFRGGSDCLLLQLPALSGQAKRGRKASLGQCTTGRDTRNMMRKQARIFDSLVERSVRNSSKKKVPANI